MLFGLITATTSTAFIEYFTSGVFLGGTLFSVAKTKKSPSKLR
ncbi:hypothetical protein [Anaerovorax odorimutans]|nr:hypothetical protein [Anaerovorax odorimutans]